MERRAITELKAMKGRGERFAMLTAYDYQTARILDEAGLPIILVGDSLGMVMLGYDSTIPVTMDDMLHHVKAVVRGTSRAHVVADMPFMSYQASVEEALHNAGRMLQEGGAQSVKLEARLHCCRNRPSDCLGRRAGDGPCRADPPIGTSTRRLQTAGQDAGGCR